MSYQTIALFSIASLQGIFSLIVLRGERRLVNKIFSIFVLSAGLWPLGLGLFILTRNLSHALYFANGYYIAAALIPTLFLLFSIVFLRKETVSPKKIFFACVPIIILSLALLINPHLIIEQVFQEGSLKDVVINPLPYALYAFYFIAYVIASYYFLLQTKQKAKKENDTVAVSQLNLIFLGTVMPYILGMTFDLILPWLGNYQYIWLGPAFTLIMVGAIGYAIAKHGLFNLKVVATQVFVFALWLFILIRILLAGDFHDQIINGVLLAATIVIGVLVIRSVVKEVNTRERIEALADELASANERLRELDRQKSEFVSIASHQLRSPLTAIKGYSSMILEGSFGPVQEKALEAINRIFESSQRLVVIIEDFLNISRIEQGRMQYEFSSVDLAKTVKEVVQEMEGNFKRANLYLKYNESTPGPFMVTADSGKIRQVVTNIIDNGVKYTPTGGITVTLHRDDERHKVLLEVSDTGIGIPPEVMPRLFEKFSRAEDAGKTNIAGTGLGLFVAKEIMKAHRGNIWVDSEGKGKGSIFYLEFMGE